jgi:hypothetical protein
MENAHVNADTKGIETTSPFPTAMEVGQTQ